MADWLHHDAAAGASFPSVAGEVEFQTDGTMVNTWEGWREMRLGVYAKRTRGRPATVQEWDRRRLPQPGTRLLFAGIETAEHFGPRMRRWAGRLGIRDAQAITVLADGAEWIWNQASVQLPGAGGYWTSIMRANIWRLAATSCMARGRPRRSSGWKRHERRCW